MFQKPHRSRIVFFSTLFQTVFLFENTLCVDSDQCQMSAVSQRLPGDSLFFLDHIKGKLYLSCLLLYNRIAVLPVQGLGTGSKEPQR